VSEETKDLSFEEAMKRLERIVGDLEAGTFSLAESLARFEEGIALGRHCRELLGRADLRIRTLVEGPDGTFAEGEPFDGE
jgi:exodeoxyribonuclease VII small subunit